MQKWEPTFQILDATTLYRWQTSGMRHSRERHEVWNRKIACRGGRQNWRETSGYIQERRRVALHHPDERFRHDSAADRSQLVPATEHCCLPKNVVPERSLSEQNSAARVKESHLVRGKSRCQLLDRHGRDPKKACHA